MSSFKPEWDGPIEGYVVNQLKLNYWKVARSCSREDVLQEAYCVFLRCKRKYLKLKEAKHFMALFKTAWYHQFTELANADTEQRAECAMPLTDEGIEVEQIGATDNDGVLAIMIREAPREVTLVLSLMLNAPQELLDAALGKPDGRERNAGSTRINRLLGLPADHDTVGTVIAYFR